MRTDGDIERDVKDELSWQPGLDATDIAVSVKDGVGTVRPDPWLDSEPLGRP
jgi:osmotically-inducible protein OsmY